MFIALGFCGAMIAYGAMAADIPDTVRETLISQGTLGGFSIIGAYVFGATWDDKGRI